MYVKMEMPGFIFLSLVIRIPGRYKDGKRSTGWNR